MVTHRPDFALTNDTPYLALTGDLRGVLREFFKGKWPRYIESALYFAMINTYGCRLYKVVYARGSAFLVVCEGNASVTMVFLRQECGNIENVVEADIIRRIWANKSINWLYNKIHHQLCDGRVIQTSGLYEVACRKHCLSLCHNCGYIF